MGFSMQYSLGRGIIHASHTAAAGFFRNTHLCSGEGKWYDFQSYHAAKRMKECFVHKRILLKISAVRRKNFQ